MAGIWRTCPYWHRVFTRAEERVFKRKTMMMVIRLEDLKFETIEKSQSSEKNNFRFEGIKFEIIEKPQSLRNSVKSVWQSVMNYFANN